MISLRESRLALQCTICHTQLEEEGSGKKCTTCNLSFPYTNNQLNFIPSVILEAEDKEANRLRDFFKRWPKFYHFIRVFFGQGLFMGLSVKKFISQYPVDTGISVNLGSGQNQIDSSIFNVDLFPYPNVHIVADVENVPFKNGTVDRAICDQVLEHVKRPLHVVSEIHRILKPGGVAYIGTPFIHPFHGSPTDYTRWTREGIANIFYQFDIVERGVRLGPFSALTLQLSYIFALIFSFGNTSLYWFLVNASMFIFFPVKLFDILVNKLPRASDSAAALYYVLRKK